METYSIHTKWIFNVNQSVFWISGRKQKSDCSSLMTNKFIQSLLGHDLDSTLIKSIHVDRFVWPNSLLAFQKCKNAQNKQLTRHHEI